MDCLSPFRLKPPPGGMARRTDVAEYMSCLFWKDRSRDVPQSYIYLRATGKWCREKWQETQKFLTVMLFGEHIHGGRPATLRSVDFAANSHGSDAGSVVPRDCASRRWLER